jgi:hypothetical protein
MLWAALSLLTQADIDFPLRPGARWVYVHDDRESIILDALEASNIGAEKTVTLRVRGWTFFGTEGDLYLSSDARGLSCHGTCYMDQVHPQESPENFLPPRLQKGTAWEGRDGFGFKAVTHDLEAVEVPAGTFQAWKIAYRGGSSEMSFDGWYAPGTGFVRFDLLRMSLTKPWGVEKSYRHDLARFEPTRGIVPVAVPALSAEERKTVELLLGRLSEPDVDARQKAAADLFALGRGVIPWLRESEDPEVRARVRQVVERFPALEYSAHLTRAKGKVGRPLPVRFALRNIASGPVQIVEAVEGSAEGRSPACLLTILDERGVEQRLQKRAECGNSNRLLRRNFVTLESGEDFDPLGPGTWRHPLLDWTPARPGVYTIDAVYDATGKIPDAWRGTGHLTPEIQKRIEAMPRGRYEAKRLTIIVEP